MLCTFLRAIGRSLGEPVVMTPEGGHDIPLLGDDVASDRVVKLAQG